MRLATEIGVHIDPRTQDLLASCGEVISTALLAHLVGTGVVRLQDPEQAGLQALALAGVHARCGDSDPDGSAISWLAPLDQVEEATRVIHWLFVERGFDHSHVSTLAVLSPSLEVSVA